MYIYFYATFFSHIYGKQVSIRRPCNEVIAFSDSLEPSAFPAGILNGNLEKFRCHQQRRMLTLLVSCFEYPRDKPFLLILVSYLKK